MTRYAVQAARALIARDIKMLVVACNTASGVALPTLEDGFEPLPVIGVIEPGAEAALAAAPDGPIAVIATEGTVKGGAYVRAIQALAPRCRWCSRPRRCWCRWRKKAWSTGEIARLAVERYLKPLLATMPQAAGSGAGLHPFSGAESDDCRGGGAGCDAGGQRRNHGRGGGRAVCKAKNLAE